MAKPKDYVWIAHWGLIMGSLEYYVKQQQEQASQDNAPLTAIFKNQEEDRWVTVKEVSNDATRQALQRLSGVWVWD